MSPEYRSRKNVVVLGLVSMFNDVASEMVYPIIPVFLTSVLGAPVAIVGFIEGVAEATANVLKVFSGWLSDRLRRRKGFVAGGYLLSALAKLLLSVAISWQYVLTARFIDRFGKGVRTAARDALIADSAGPHERGAAFGLHRALDTVGAVVGPLIALLLLQLWSGNYPRIFLVAAIPAFLGVALLLVGVKEPPHDSSPPRVPITLRLSQFGKPFRLFLLASVVFALGNSSDAFLILRSQSLGFSVTGTVLLYVAFNVVYSLLSYPFGSLSDRLGMRSLLTLSFFLFALVYAGFGFAPEGWYLWIFFVLYGVYMAMSEGISKAYIANLVPAEVKGTAIGLFAAVTGLVTFFSSLLAGILWNELGAHAPFYFGAGLSLAAGLLFIKIGTGEAGSMQ